MKSKSANFSEMYEWAVDLFPVCRSLTGDGVRHTLKYIKNLLPDLKIYEVPTGTKAFDWVVPDEWNIRDAYIMNDKGQKIVDFKLNNLHVVSYSEPIDAIVSLEELDKHLHSMADRPKAIPYITSYYERNWGFSISHNQRQTLTPGNYRVVIDSTLEPGSMSYGELFIPGSDETEVFLSTYICHPSMANNEISGPVVATALAKWLLSLDNTRHSYRFIFIPETIGSILYLSRNLNRLKERVIAGFNITCVGDNLAHTYLASRKGDTLADRVAKHVLGHIAPNYKTYSFLHRGSDERQYCAPGVDLPVVSVMRSRYGDYPQYHTSDDNLDFISPEGLGGSFNVLSNCIKALEANKTYCASNFCEPQLGKRGLIENIGLGSKKINPDRRILSNLLAYSDGYEDLLGVCDLIGTPIWESEDYIKSLIEYDLLREGHNVI